MACSTEASSIAVTGGGADGQRPESGVGRAEEPVDERLWTSLFRIDAWTGSSLGLENTVCRPRGALIDIGRMDAADADTGPLPANLDLIAGRIRQPIQPSAG